MAAFSRSPRHKGKEHEVLTPSTILLSRLKDETEARLIEIHWVDAIAVGGEDWADEDDLDLDGAESIAVGYVVNENEETITVVSLVNRNHYAHGITIPKGCITDIVDMKAVKKRS